MTVSESDSYHIDSINWHLQGNSVLKFVPKLSIELSHKLSQKLFKKLSKKQSKNVHVNCSATSIPEAKTIEWTYHGSVLDDSKWILITLILSIDIYRVYQYHCLVHYMSTTNPEFLIFFQDFFRYISRSRSFWLRSKWTRKCWNINRLFFQKGQFATFWIKSRKNWLIQDSELVVYMRWTWDVMFFCRHTLSYFELCWVKLQQNV